MFVFTPAEPEAQACRLWWMVGLIAAITYGRFCLADLGKAGFKRRDKGGGKTEEERRHGKAEVGARG